jgi:hypothetical protein
MLAIRDHAATNTARSSGGVMRRLAAVALASMLAAGCGPGPRPATSTPTATLPAAAATSAVPATGAAATAAPTTAGDRPGSLALPSAEPAPVMQRFPVDDAPIGIVGLGNHVWATGDRYLLRINVETGATTSFATPVGTGSGSLGASADALWLADHRGNAVYRIDPATGGITATVEMSRPVGVVATGDAIWVGSEGFSGLTRIDPTSATVLGSVDIKGGFAVGDGSLWFAQRAEARLLRVDLQTHEEQASIDFPLDARPTATAGQGSCFVWGELPDAWWTWCFTEHDWSTPIRIDARTNQAVGTVRVGGSVSGRVFVIDGLSWFVLDNALVAVDSSDRVTRVISLGTGFGADNAIVHAGGIWIPNEFGREVVRIELAALG